jgi:hypothetical protein
MHRQSILCVRALVLLAGLQVGCQASAPRPDPYQELLRLDAEMRREEARQQREAMEGFCVVLGEMAANTARQRDSVPLDAMLVNPVDPKLASDPFIVIPQQVIIYAYTHREQSPEELRVWVLSWCLAKGRSQQ